jgi:putative SOS response-associated peptidase YedK
MCGRSSLTKSEKELEARFKATFYSEDLEKYNPLPNFNVAPTHVLPIITNQDPTHFLPLRWGLIPYWAKDIKIGYRMINARVETVQEKSAFKSALAKRRCLVPLDGYYEWKKNGKRKTPYRITLKDQSIFTCAGLWETWKSPQGERISSFTIITQPPSPSISHIHDRMPAMLTAEQEKYWIDLDMAPAEALKLIAPYPDEMLDYYMVSSRVGKVTENDPGLILPIEAPLEDGQATMF